VLVMIDRQSNRARNRVSVCDNRPRRVSDFDSVRCCEFRASYVANSSPTPSAPEFKPEWAKILGWRSVAGHSLTILNSSCEKLASRLGNLHKR